MTFRSERELDSVDWQLMDELQSDGRLSFSEVGRRVNLSAPAVAERAGYPILAFVELRCSLGHCVLKTSTADDFPEVVELHKLSGDHCTMLKVRTASLEHLEGLFERIGKHGELRSKVVLSTQYDDGPVQPADEDYLTPTRHEGWTR